MYDVIFLTDYIFSDNSPLFYEKKIIRLWPFDEHESWEFDIEYV